MQQMVRRYVFADLLHPVGQLSVKCIVMGANSRAAFIRWKGNHAIPPLRIPEHYFKNNLEEVLAKQGYSVVYLG